jgi:hypothetical protein
VSSVARLDLGHFEGPPGFIKSLTRERFVGSRSVTPGLPEGVPMRVFFIVAIALAVLSGLCVWVRNSEWWQVDRCLDAGGRWNYETQICEGAR